MNVNILEEKGGSDDDSEWAPAARLWRPAEASQAEVETWE